ncbi:DUF541 domain-containing protein [Baekduia soli]|uniref:DUF541 domain-containing protein n=1 Tax=Baekduia soli TaxID=496014 RepID=A0A5B8UB61_9ACTN|nr:SIMPL domain-containing protein [Baekduia soli]QEC50396.1 DUF541 domain-containing protein [Baekduia soli]
MLTIAAGVAACAVGAPGAMAQQAATPAGPTITANGTATVKPVPVDAHDDASIAKSVKVAAAKALPLAVADARTHAAALAGAAGLQLGALVSISDAAQPGYPFFYSPQNGTFGNGHFCGQVRKTKTVVRKDGTRRRVVLKGTHKVCRVPSSVSAGVALTYAVAT